MKKKNYVLLIIVFVSFLGLAIMARGLSTILRQQLSQDFASDDVKGLKTSLIPTLKLFPPSRPEIIAFKEEEIFTDSRLKLWLEEMPDNVPLTEYLSVVVIPEQKNYVFQKKKLLGVYTVSTGSKDRYNQDRSMPEGLWRIGEKRDSDLEEIYGPRLMFLEVWDKGEFVKTTRAFHGTNEPENLGQPTSLGCVNHSNEDIVELYDLLPQGTLVISTNKTQVPDWEILVGGTVVLSRGVDERIRKYNNINYPWEKIAPYFQAADLGIVNLKSPFLQGCPYIRDKPVFCGQPEYVEGVSFAGINLVSLAGNHLGDHGEEGILETLQILSEAGVSYTGAGEDKSRAYQSVIYQLKDSSGNKLKVGFFSFNSVPGSALPADEQQVGVAWWDEELVSRIVKNLRPQVDVLLVMANWGPEYAHQPSDEQIEIGRKLVDWGVDVVLGDQAHWVQKYEEDEKGLIFYGLGNLVFDQMWSEKTRQGLLLKLKINQEKKISFELIPTIIEDYAQPRIANQKEAQEILQSIK